MGRRIDRDEVVAPAVYIMLVGDDPFDEQISEHKKLRSFRLKA